MFPQHFSGEFTNWPRLPCSSLFFFDPLGSGAQRRYCGVLQRLTPTTFTGSPERADSWLATYVFTPWSTIVRRRNFRACELFTLLHVPWVIDDNENSLVGHSVQAP